jgi:hypothetical protein
MDITTDIQSMTMLVLTVNGKAAAAVQDAEAYQRLCDMAAEASVEEAIRQARKEIVAGLGRPAGDVFDEIRAEFDIPR